MSICSLYVFRSICETQSTHTFHLVITLHFVWRIVTLARYDRYEKRLFSDLHFPSARGTFGRETLAYVSTKEVLEGSLTLIYSSYAICKSIVNHSYIIRSKRPLGSSILIEATYRRHNAGSTPRDLNSQNLLPISPNVKNLSMC